MVTNITVVDYIVFIGFLVGIVLFGCSFYFRGRKNKEATDQFTKANGSLPSWVVGMSIFATFVSSISFLGYPGEAFSNNWNPFVFSISIPIAAWLAAKLFVPLYRSMNSVSAYHYLEVKFGYWARVYVAVCYLLTQLARMGSILFLLALPLNYMLGWSIPTIIIITGVAVLIFSAMGGIKAVIWTDAIQGIILIVGAIACAIILTAKIPGGLGQLIEVGNEYNKFSMGSLSSSLTEKTFWVLLIYGLFTNLQNYGIDQNYIQRYMTAKDEKSAKNSTLFGGLLYVPVSLLFVYIGTALFVYYKTSGTLPADVAGDSVFPYFIVNGLPTGITGLMIASIMAAGMSTVSTSLNSSSTIVLTDFYKHFKKDVSEKEGMVVLYTTTVVLGVLGVIVALLMMGVDGVLDTWWKLASIFSGGMLGLFLLGFICKKVNKMAAVLGVIAGLLVIFWMSLSQYLFTGAWEPYQCHLNGNLTIVIGTVVIFVIGFLFTWLFKNKASMSKN